jgi:uncharacterized protein (DUF1684 family)
MIGAWQCDEPGLIACCLRCLRICLAHRERDAIIGGAMNHHLRHVERQQRGGRGGGVAVRHPVEAAAEQFRGCSPTQIEPPAHVQIIDARLADDPYQRRSWHIKRHFWQMPPGEAGIGGQPQGQMAACRMPDGNNALLIDLWQRAQKSGGVRDIEQGVGPAAASIAQAPILNIPGRNPPRRQVSCQPIHQPVIVGHPPEAAMNQDGRWKWPLTAWQVQLCKVLRIRPIRKSLYAHCNVPRLLSRVCTGDFPCMILLSMTESQLCNESTRQFFEVTAMSEYFELYDYRCRVAAIYRERNRAYLAGEDTEKIWQRFRETRDALFAHHPQSALDEEQRRHFQGLRYFPYNPAMVFTVEVDTNVEPVRQSIAMNAEESMNMTTVGRLRFAVEGQEVSLSLYWLDIYGGGLFLPFRDATCPVESYGGGRYLFDTIKGSDFLPVRDADSSPTRMVLDFNYAYNPSCAYNSRWFCPLAPMENRMRVPVRAGEQKYHQ